MGNWPGNVTLVVRYFCKLPKALSEMQHRDTLSLNKIEHELIALIRYPNAFVLLEITVDCQVLKVKQSKTPSPRKRHWKTSQNNT